MKNITESSDRSFTTTLSDLIEYPASGIFRKTLLKDNNVEYNLLCLVAGKELNEHTASRNAVITVVEGSGNLNLAGKDIALVPGVFIFMPARTPHAVQARSNLAFMLALSE
ncbi:cupin domain-containing protein [Chamaesiphon polymorphus]|uniref:Cupin domain-containing protein n=1 Tax=Chamaesiphon polymorphus CCALA 037 TaxID=2107692 RepID=A0A2T1G0Q2_9CYAN|nr:cupin domain-containing protein [Chamaesiphon polymorphus]PSB50746.1 cupin domain-containing protein [Chamaesiphon polymorphus CCALA 037]